LKSVEEDKGETSSISEENEEEEEEEEDGTTFDDEEDMDSEDEERLLVGRDILEKERLIEEAKERIASLSSEILENPEEKVAVVLKIPSGSPFLTLYVPPSSLRSHILTRLWNSHQWEFGPWVYFLSLLSSRTFYQSTILYIKVPVYVVEDSSPKTLFFSFFLLLSSYRIRELTDKEKNQKMSKEVRKTRIFEEGILKYYQKFLERLEAIYQGFWSAF